MSQEKRTIGFINEPRTDDKKIDNRTALKVSCLYLLQVISAALVAGTAFAQKETITDKNTGKEQSILSAGALGITLLKASLPANSKTDFKVETLGTKPARKLIKKIFEEKENQELAQNSQPKIKDKIILEKTSKNY